MKWPEEFERIPTRIYAMRWTGDNYFDLRAWGAPVTFLGDQKDLWLWVQANAGQLRLELGEWIAKDDLGFYPIKDDGSGVPRLYRRPVVMQDANA